MRFFMTWVHEVCQDPMKLYTEEELAALPDAAKKELAKGKVTQLSVEQQEFLMKKIQEFSHTYVQEILSEPDYSKLAHLSGNILYEIFKKTMADPTQAEQIPAAIKVIFQGAAWLPTWSFNKLSEKYFAQGLQELLANKTSGHSSSPSTTHTTTTYDGDGNVATSTTTTYDEYGNASTSSYTSTTHTSKYTSNYKPTKFDPHSEIHQKLDQGDISFEEAIAKLKGLPAGTFFVRTPESGKVFVYVDKEGQIKECDFNDDSSRFNLKITYADISDIVEEAYLGMIDYQLPQKALNNLPAGTFLLRDSDAKLGVKIFNYVNLDGAVNEYRLTLKSEGFVDKTETAYPTLNAFYEAHAHFLKFPFKKSDMEVFQSEPPKAKMASSHSGLSQSVSSGSTSMKKNTIVLGVLPPPNYVLVALKDLKTGDYIIRKSGDSNNTVINFVNADQQVDEYRLLPVEDGFQEKKSDVMYPSIAAFIEANQESLQALIETAAPKVEKTAFPKIAHPKTINKNVLSPQKAKMLLNSESEGTYLIRGSEVDTKVKIINYATESGMQEFRLRAVDVGYILLSSSKPKDLMIYPDLETFISNKGHILKTRLHVEGFSEDGTSTVTTEVLSE